MVLCGRREAEAPGVLVASLAERFGERDAMERPGPLLERLAAEVAAEVEERARAEKR